MRSSPAINRTTLELKHRNSSLVWHPSGTINRTTLELKQVKKIQLTSNLTLSIVPHWN